MMSAETITIVGAGRVGTALAIALYSKGCNIQAILSLSKEKALQLAAVTEAEYYTDYSIPYETDLAIIAVPDHALTEVAGKLKAGTRTVIVHTAGSLGLEVFPESAQYGRGVLYPLQTFSPSRKVDLNNVPLFIDGESDETLILIRKVASLISEKVFVLDLERRRKLHLSAVFVCNFVNHMLSSGEEIAIKADVEFNLFEPLVMETILKAFELGPSRSQTGPAARNDLNTIEKHIDLLSYDPHLKEIYKTITESIINKQTHSHI